MSLICGEGRETIAENFSIIYRLGTNQEGLVTPNSKVYVPPNSAVCMDHLRIPRESMKVDPLSIDGVVYGIDFESTAGFNILGNIDLFTVRDNGGRLRFVGQQTMAQYQPRALKIIDGELELKEHVLADLMQRGYLPQGSKISDMESGIMSKVDKENPGAFWYGCLCPKDKKTFVPHFMKL